MNILSHVIRAVDAKKGGVTIKSLIGCFLKESGMLSARIINQRHGVLISRSWICPSYLPLADKCAQMSIMFGVVYHRRSSRRITEIHAPFVETQGSIRSGEN